jgi:hypothetical protein
MLGKVVDDDDNNMATSVDRIASKELAKTVFAANSGHQGRSEDVHGREKCESEHTRSPSSSYYRPSGTCLLASKFLALLNLLLDDLLFLLLLLIMT